MEDRRNFVLKIASGMAAASFGSDSKKTYANKSILRKVFVHHVFFWLKEPDNEEVRKQFEKGIQQLIQVPLIQLSHVGVSVESPREVVDDSFTYSYLAFFRNKEDQNSYQTHPIHLQFIEDYQHLWKKVIVYDAMD
jgi:hypothetical protein